MKHRIAVDQMITVYYTFEGTEAEAEELCKKINDDTLDMDIDEAMKFESESDYNEISNARVVESDV